MVTKEELQAYENEWLQDFQNNNRTIHNTIALADERLHNYKRHTLSNRLKDEV
jgi:hypothetical protein